MNVIDRQVIYTLFPICVACYLLVRTEQRLDTLNVTIAKLRECISNLARR